jgi:glycosyltransferase involved in cell wall biosynthesis
MSLSQKTCRSVIIQQPALPKYRKPIFRELANRAGVNLKVYFSNNDASLENVKADGFDAKPFPIKSFTIGKRKLMWHSAQWDSARRGACNVLILSWNVQYLSLIPTLVRARFNGIRTILWGHGFSKTESPLRKWTRDAIGRLADALVFYDHVTAKKFVDSGWSKKRIFVAPNSLDQFEIQRAREKWLQDLPALREEQIKRGLVDKKNLIYVGRIYQENRLDLMVSALPEILKKHSDIQLLVIGEVNDCALEIQCQAEKLGVSHLIKWLGPIYDEQTISLYMLSSQLFCYPANIGLSIMHAMGYGVPVITGDNISTHNPEIHVLRNGENGILFHHLDSNDLAEKISFALSSPGFLARMGRISRETVLGGFTIKHMVDGFISAIETVLES